MEGIDSLKEHADIVISVLAMALFIIVKKYAEMQEKRQDAVEASVEILDKELQKTNTKLNTLTTEHHMHHNKVHHASDTSTQEEN